MHLQRDESRDKCMYYCIAKRVYKLTFLFTLRSSLTVRSTTFPGVSRYSHSRLQEVEPCRDCEKHDLENEIPFSYSRCT